MNDISSKLEVPATSASALNKPLWRRWHRWLSVPFAVIMLWISVTGVLSQVGALVNNGGFGEERREMAGPQPGVPTGFTCPETMICRPKPQQGGWNLGLLHHLHSGESFGPAGTIVSILSGLTLVFFAISGAVMYVQLFRSRAARVRPGQPKWFWR